LALVNRWLMDLSTTLMMLMIPVMVVALILLWRFFVTQDRKELEESEHVIRLALEAEEAERRK
jgi:hypothetical protein